MKLSHVTFALALISSQAVLAQYTPKEEIEVGLGVSQFPNSNQQTASAKIGFRSRHGIFVPVNLDIGKDVNRYALGLGYKTGKDLSKIFSYSVAAAVSQINYSEDIESIMKKDKKRLVTLLQQEVNFQVSKRITLGVNLNLDLTMLDRNYEASDMTTRDQFLANGYYEDKLKDGTYYWKKTDIFLQKADFQTDQEYRNNIISVKNSSASSFGIGLKINLGK